MEGSFFGFIADTMFTIALVPRFLEGFVYISLVSCSESTSPSQKPVGTGRPSLIGSQDMRWKDCRTLPMTVQQRVWWSFGDFLADRSGPICVDGFDLIYRPGRPSRRADLHM